MAVTLPSSPVEPTTRTVSPFFRSLRSASEVAVTVVLSPVVTVFSVPSEVLITSLPSLTETMVPEVKPPPAAPPAVPFAPAKAPAAPFGPPARAELAVFLPMSTPPTSPTAIAATTASAGVIQRRIPVFLAFVVWADAPTLEAGTGAGASAAASEVSFGPDIDMVLSFYSWMVGMGGRVAARSRAAPGWVAYSPPSLPDRHRRTLR